MSDWHIEIQQAQLNTQEWTCDICDEKVTMTAQEAFDEGWDVPPWFKGYVKCNECLISDLPYFNGKWDRIGTVSRDED